MCAKNYGNWLAVDKVIAEIIWLTFLAHPVYTLYTVYSVYSIYTLFHWVRGISWVGRDGLK